MVNHRKWIRRDRSLHRGIRRLRECHTFELAIRNRSPPGKGHNFKRNRRPERVERRGRRRNRTSHHTHGNKIRMKPTTNLAINLFLIIEIASFVWCKEIATQNDTNLSRMTRDGETGRGMNHDLDYHDVEKPKAEKPWLGYYDFLITEGSYKFWVVFQLFTIGVLIYSAFAAIYYAKFTINDYENYDDYLLGRSSRSIRSVPSTQTAFLGLPVETYLQIFNAISNYGNK